MSDPEGGSRRSAFHLPRTNWTYHISMCAYSVAVHRISTPGQSISSGSIASEGHLFRETCSQYTTRTWNTLRSLIHVWSNPTASPKCTRSISRGQHANVLDDRSPATCCWSATFTAHALRQFDTKHHESTPLQ